MTQPAETHHPHFAQLVTGHFHERAGYATFRVRGTDDYLLMCTLGGRGRIGYAGGELLVHAGDLALLKPGVRHDYGVEPELERWEFLWTHFHARPAWLGLLDWPEAAPGLGRLQLQDPVMRRRVVTRLRDMHAYATGALKERDAFAMNALEEVLLWCDAANPLGAQARVDERVRAAMAYACAHLTEKLALEDLARHASLSVSRLAHLFRAQVGLTPQQFIEQQRLERACQLLRFTPYAIKQVAQQVGFENPFYFTLRFKRHTGMSPRAYRQRGGSRQ
jgi:AraC family transcriptional regulator of arabinose operon